ncbi:MAG: Na(+)/H(+) antiporter subunit D [Nitrospirae bacterium]|nr:Na(+)/H(+) antiporter subunit D [Candidatus Manganitrophaceae bacterium]
MIDLWIHPGLLFFLAAAALPFVKETWKVAIKLGVPVLGFLTLLLVSHGDHGVLPLMGQQEMVFGRIDKLSLVFGYVITIATLIGMVFSLHVKKNHEHMAGFVYAGSALGTVFAGDFLTIFLFWEAMAFSSALLIFYAQWRNAAEVGMRYLYVHIFGGLLLLAGIFIYVADTGSIAFNALPHEGLGPMLILAGFLLNAAVPPFSAWLPDAYPESTITGVVFMSALTTKTAVYVLLRGFSGMEFLVPLGVFMALYGVVYAVIENDIRRLLAYHIISQVGYMVAAAGMGSEMAVNGATSHAFAHILYKGLLMMGMSSVILMTGKRKLTELGGLYKYMPWTFMLYMVGGFAISGFPFFSGFVSKSMVISAAIDLDRPWVSMLLTLASAGTFLHTGLKLPYYVFFWKDWDQKKIEVKDPPKNMLWGMGLAAFACTFIGVVPGALYQALPFEVDYHPYTWGHVVGAYQILLLTAVGFFMLLKKLDPEELISLDTDWSYRKAIRGFNWFIKKPVVAYENYVTEVYKRLIIEPAKKLSRIGWTIDTWVFDGLVNASGWATLLESKISEMFDMHVIDGALNKVPSSIAKSAKRLRKLQTGRTQNYIMAMVCGLVLFAIVSLIYY